MRNACQLLHGMARRSTTCLREVASQIPGQIRRSSASLSTRNKSFARERVYRPHASQEPVVPRTRQCARFEILAIFTRAAARLSARRHRYPLWRLLPSSYAALARRVAVGSGRATLMRLVGHRNTAAATAVALILIPTAGAIVSEHHDR